MKTKILSIFFGLAAILSAQTALTTTTTTSALTAVQTSFTVSSATGITAGVSLYLVDPGQVRGELVLVRAVSGTNITVNRLSNKAAHVSGALVWIGAAVGTPNQAASFQNFNPAGACTAANTLFTPWINIQTGQLAFCNVTTGNWVQAALRSFHVPLTNCTFAPTTLTTTNIFTQVGASNVAVVQGTSNAAAGTNTLTCTFLPPTNPVTGMAGVLLDITLFFGSQTTAPTSLGTSTLGTITFPAAIAGSETASVVTPVAAGGTVTTVSPSNFSTVTTAGAFLTMKHTYATLVQFGTDLQLFQYTMPFLQSAAAAMVINTPGLIVHYLDTGAQN